MSARQFFLCTIFLPESNSLKCQKTVSLNCLFRFQNEGNLEVGKKCSLTTPKCFQNCYGFLSSSLTSPDVDQTWDIFCVIECHCNVEIACHFSKFVAERWLENMQTHFFRWFFCHSRIFLPLVYRLSYGLFVGKTNRLCGKVTPFRNELLKTTLQKSCFQTTQGQF